MTQLNRKQFLRGKWNAKDVPIRPPWSVKESTFITLCNGCLQCGDCITACPENILSSGVGRFPQIDFSTSGCSFCGKCAEVCPSGAIDSVSEQAWNYYAVISAGCLSKQGVECRSCGEACEVAAIKFRPRIGGVAEPILDQQVCTGCGECVGVCPVNALSIQIPQEISREIINE